MASEGRRFCENCGAQVSETTNFCQNCGAAQRPSPEVPTGPPPTTPQTGRIETPSAAGVPPPPEPESQSNILRNVIIALVVVIVLILLSRGCGGGADTSSSSSPAEQKVDTSEEVEQKEGPKEEPEEESAGIGETVAVGDVEWTVTSARRANQLSQQGIPPEFAKTEQGDFVIVDFDFTNNGSEAITLNTESLALVDSEGRESRPNSEAFLYTPEERQIFLERVNPGVTKQGQAIFEVAPDASGFQLQAGDARMFTDDNAYVDLGS